MKPKNNWRAIHKDTHVHAFSVAASCPVHLLVKIHRLIGLALETGASFRDAEIVIKSLSVPA